MSNNSIKRFHIVAASESVIGPPGSTHGRSFGSSFSQRSLTLYWSRVSSVYGSRAGTGNGWRCYGSGPSISTHCAFASSCTTCGTSNSKLLALLPSIVELRPMRESNKKPFTLRHPVSNLNTGRELQDLLWQWPDLKARLPPPKRPILRRCAQRLSRCPLIRV